MFVFCSLRELERPRTLWDQQPERRQIETRQQTQDLRKASPVTWWRALKVEDERNWNPRDIQDTTRDMQERIRALEIQLQEAQMEVTERKHFTIK